MSIKSRSDLEAFVTSYINTNGVQGITGAILNEFLLNLTDSSINKNGDTGILGKLRYNAIFSIDNDADIPHKKYVDDLISSLGEFLPVADLGGGSYQFQLGSNYETFGAVKELLFSNSTDGTLIDMGPLGWGILVSDSVDSSIRTLFSIAKDGIRFRTQNSLFTVQIVTDDITGNYKAKMPDKTGDQTFAMISDLTGGSGGEITDSGIISLLENDSNWTENIYTGTPITTLNPGDFYFNTTHDFKSSSTRIRRIPFKFL